MDVLFLDQFSELGGAQKCLLDLLPAIEERGWRASAALPGDGPLVKLLRERNVQVHPIPCGPYRSGSKSIGDMLRFRRDVLQQVSVLRQLKFDLLYVNGPRLLAGAAMAYNSERPVLFHAHSRVPAGPEGWLAGWSIRKMKATVVACARAVTPNVREDNLRVIANGTPDMSFGERRSAGWRIGMIGAISPDKGQIDFLRAAAILAPEFKDARFVLCGAPVSSQGNYFLMVEKYADFLPVDLLGWRDDVGKVLAKLDLLVIASKMEGMPRVMLEAFSAGVPVVAFPVGGIPEVIVDGETGFLVPERTAEALAARTRGIFRGGRESLRKVALNARRAWERKYTVEAYRKNVTAVMESLVSGRPTARETESLRLRR
ncbi:MAG: glycosyltransferase family 4 protein [Bryobacteraceae bacterium]